MRSTALAWSCLTALVACCVAVQLEETSRTSSSARLSNVDGVSKDDVAALKKQIADLRADKSGLVHAVRRLLKANQTETQKKMFNALRGAQLKVQATKKELTDLETADKAEIKKLQLMEQKTEVQMKQDETKFDALELKERAEKKSVSDAKKQAATIASLQAQLATEEAALASLHKRGESARSKKKALEAKVAKMKKHNSGLEGDIKGLEGTVQKLWNANAPAGSKTMLNMLKRQEEKLKVVDHTKESEEKQFAQEKSELSSKLSAAEHSVEVDDKALKKMQGDNQHLRAAIKDHASLEMVEEDQGAKLAEELQRKNNQLEMELTKEKKVLASEKAESTIKKDLPLSSLQQKVVASQALVHQKDAEIKDVSARGVEYYGKSWLKTKALLEDKIAKQEKRQKNLEAKFAELTVAAKAKEELLNAASKEGSATRAELKAQQRKLAYAVNKENTEMLRVEQMQTQKKYLIAAVQKDKELEPKLASLEKHDKALQVVNQKLIAAEKSEREQLNGLKDKSGTVVHQALTEKKKLDFAVDQENTQMMAVKILQSENSKLKQGLQDQTQLEAELKQIKTDELRKDVTIKALKAQSGNVNAKVTSLIGQIGSLKRTNGLLEDQYVEERHKLRSIADQDSTESLALQVLRGEDQKLKVELKNTAEDEAVMAARAKTNEAKAATSEGLAADKFALEKELAALHAKEAALTKKNTQLQETVVSMASKEHAREMEHHQKSMHFHHVAKVPARPVLHEVPQAEGLEKASEELSKLTTQLHIHQAAEVDPLEADPMELFPGLHD